MKINLFICFILIAVFLMSCSSSDKTAKVTNTPLKKTSWTLYQLNGNPVKSEKDVTINFNESDNKTYGNAACNNFTGTYILSGKNLSFNPLASTKKMCPELEYETVYLKSLQNTVSYKISGNELSLYDSSGTLLMIFKSK